MKFKVNNPKCNPLNMCEQKKPVTKPNEKKNVQLILQMNREKNCDFYFNYIDGGEQTCVVNLFFFLG